jgi:hypothetical protein
MDDLDALLAPDPIPPEPLGMREAVARDAGRVLTRRRWLRRTRWAGALAACYAAGLATMWLWSQAVRTPQPEVVEHEPSARPVVLPGEDEPYRSGPPEQLERWAIHASGERRGDLYRRAGDAFLQREDVMAALRCYRLALDGSAVSDLAVRADTDTWLLMSLKMSRQKEIPDARFN